MAPGSAIPARSIVGIGSVITGCLKDEGNLIAGVPAKVIKALSTEDEFLIEHRTRPDLPDGCPEKVDFVFLEYVWNFQNDTRPRIMSRLGERRADQTLAILRNPADVSRFRRAMGIL